MYCNNCGKSIDEKAVICTNCGVETGNKKTISNGVMAAGWVGAFIMPLAGWIIGGFACARDRQGQGIAMLIVSTVMFFFWLGVQNG